MNLKTIIGAAALALTLAHGPAWAIEVPVTYWVDAKELKASAPAGTMLTFELHQDPTCSSLYYLATVDIDSVSLGVEKLKLAAIKGSAKPPKATRINAELAGAVPAAEVYLKVTGTGILAVGGECQVQVAGVAGPQGAAGTAGATGPTGPTGPTGAQGEAGLDGTDGLVGPTGATGPVGPAGSGGSPTQAVFGTGPITHHTGASWVLEATAAGTLQLRTTTAGDFLNFSIIYPTSCAGGSSSMSSVFRFSFSVGDTLSATLCNEGSMMLVGVYENNGNTSTQFRCWRLTSNANVCQRLN